jgi:hypothetical protein
MSDPDESAVCCFCGLSVSVELATVLEVFPPGDEGSQGLYCHGRCLAERLDPSVPSHPALDD